MALALLAVISPSPSRPLHGAALSSTRRRNLSPAWRRAHLLLDPLQPPAGLPTPAPGGDVDLAGDGGGDEDGAELLQACNGLLRFFDDLDGRRTPGTIFVN